MRTEISISERGEILRVDAFLEEGEMFWVSHRLKDEGTQRASMKDESRNTNERMGVNEC